MDGLTVKALVALCRERRIPYSGKRKAQLVALLAGPAGPVGPVGPVGPLGPLGPLGPVGPTTRSKSNAKANEERDIAAIVKALNDTTSPVGQKIAAEFAVVYPGQEIIAARRHGSTGSRNAHYDFEVCLASATDITWLRVEHKGSKICRPIAPHEAPWKAGVQFHNGGCEKYAYAKLYARIWYDTYIASGELKTAFGIATDTPSFDDWWAGVCIVQGRPTLPFGIELKTAVETARNGGSLLAERARVNTAFIAAVTDPLLDEFTAQLVTVANEALRDKDAWMTVCGDVGGTADDFHVRWFPRFTVGKIVSRRFLTCADVVLECTCDDGFVLRAHMRWGYGAGFSNLRVDLK